MLANIISAFLPKRRDQRPMQRPIPIPSLTGEADVLNLLRPQPNPAQGFYPGATPQSANQQPLAAPMLPEPQDEVARDYEQAGGVPLETPSFYPGAEAESRRASAYGRRDKLLREGAPKELSFGKRMLRGALLGLGAGRGIGGAIGGAATGAALTGFFPGMERQLRTPGEIAKVNAEIGGIEGERATDQKWRRQEVERENIVEDNRRLSAQHEDRMEAKKKEGSWKALNRLVQQKHYDPKNPAHTRLADLAGVEPATLEGWDDRKPNEKMVAGVTYRLNAKGEYEPTNLPTDESKVLTDYEVTMPNGEKRKYKVSQKDAANFSTQMSALGARFEENARQRDFQANENQKTRQFQSTLEAAKMQHRTAMKQFDIANGRQKTLASERAKFVSAYTKANGTPPPEAEIETYLNAVVTMLDEPE